MISRFLIVFLLLIVSLTSFSQDIGKKKFNLKWLKSDITVRKSGPYIGLQRGLYFVPEFGGEMQWKKVKLIKPITNAVHAGFNYNFLYNVLGYDMGYWFKTGRMNLTYGANLIYRTDFTHDKIGFAPIIGYKFTQLHLQTGYHFMAPFTPEIRTNTFFVSLRFVMVNNRNVDFDKK